MRDTNILTMNGVDVNKGLELLGDMTMYDSILNDFIDGYDERMKKIETYRLNNDMPNYAIEVHSLKSDSKYLGFMTLADLAYKHEMASKAGDLTSVNNHYQELITEAGRIIAVAKKYMGKDEEVPTTPGEAINNRVVEDAPPVVQMISKEEVELSTKAILVADDSKIIRNFVNDIFSDKYEVLMASNGQEVVNIVAANPNRIAALLLDLNMPGVDGFQVLEYFNQNNLFTKIPVSIISGANDKESIDRAFKYPIVDMLNKPFNMENVKLVVEKTISLSGDN